MRRVSWRGFLGVTAYETFSRRFKLSSRKRKRVVSRLLHGRFHNHSFFWRSAEELAWLNIAPVGREFGSPDYDRLMQQDHDEVKANLSSLIEKCAHASIDMDYQFELPVREHVINVQLALHALGHNVSVAVAAAVWRHHSNSLMADWISGAETATSAKKTILIYCRKTH